MASAEKSVFDEDDPYFDPLDDEDEGGRGPVLTVLAMLIIIAFLGMGWVMYNQGKRDGLSSGPSHLQTETGSIKVAPENPGGLQVPHQDKQVFNTITGSAINEPEELLPPAEEPIELSPPPLTGNETTMSDAVEILPDEIADAAGSAPSVGLDAEPPAESIEALIGEADSATADVAIITAPPAEVAPVEPPLAAAEQPVAEVAETIEPVVAAPPAVAEAPVEETQTSAIPDAPAPAPATAGVITDPYVVQVASFRSDADARRAWDGLEGRFDQLLVGQNPDIKAVDLAGKGTYHRLRIGPLEGRQAAADLCTNLKAQGQDCLVTRQ
jgi:cell division protein FtsN